MAFVNEFSSLEDREKFGIAELQRKHHIPGWDAWTIDRERHIILMLTGQGSKDEPDNGMSFVLSKESVVTHHFFSLEIDREHQTLHWWMRFWRGEVPTFESEADRLHFEERNSILKEALKTFREAGPYESSYNVFDVVFENF